MGVMRVHGQSELLPRLRSTRETRRTDALATTDWCSNVSMQGVARRLSGATKRNAPGWGPGAFRVTL